MVPKVIFQHLVNADRALTIQLNQLLRWKSIRTFFAAISSLGDGKFWYILMLTLPLAQGMEGLKATAHIGASGLVTLVLYKAVKGATQRPRPGAVFDAIEQGANVLDEYSFPSGHTMHAVVFTCVACAWAPGLLPLLVTFSALTAISRVVLGLHYPSDVVLGAVFGLIISVVSVSIVF